MHCQPFAALGQCATHPTVSLTHKSTSSGSGNSVGFVQGRGGGEGSGHMLEVYVSITCFVKLSKKKPPENAI